MFEVVRNKGIGNRVYGAQFSTGSYSLFPIPFFNLTK